MTPSDAETAVRFSLSCPRLKFSRSSFVPCFVRFFFGSGLARKE